MMPQEPTPSGVAVGDFATDDEIGETLRRWGWSVARVTGRGSWSGAWGWCRAVDVDLAESTSPATITRPVRVWAAQVDDDAPPATTRVAGGAGWYGIWAHPDDPALPGLADVCTVGGIADLIGRCVDGTGRRVEQRIDQRVVEVVALEPLQRAVVRVGRPGHCVYVKVLPPASMSDAVGVLVDAHRRVGEAGVRTPAVLAVDDERGLVVLDELPGTTLAEHLEHGLGLPRPGALVALIDRVGSIATPRTSPASALAVSMHHGLARIAREFEHLALRCTEIAERVDRFVDSTPLIGTVHGDLHDRQLLVHHEPAADHRSTDSMDIVVGVVDLDDLGRGDMLDDIGRLTAHMAVRALTHPTRSDRIDDYVGRFVDVMAERVDPIIVYQRAALAMVALGASSLRLEPDRRPLDPAVFLDAATSLLGGELPRSEPSRASWADR